MCPKKENVEKKKNQNKKKNERKKREKKKQFWGSISSKLFPFLFSRMFEQKYFTFKIGRFIVDKPEVFQQNWNSSLGECLEFQVETRITFWQTQTVRILIF